MEMDQNEIYRNRKRFFNEHAEQWMEMCYRNPTTGRYDKYDSSFNRLFSLFPLRPGDWVLDIGCGSGVLVPFILDRINPGGVLFEVDFAEKMIEVNRRLHPQGDIRFIVSDAENVPLVDSSCDVIICFSSFPHFHDKAKAMERLSRILKPQGIFVVSHFDSSDAIKKRHESCPAIMHDYLPSEPEMRQMFEDVVLKIEIFIDEPGFYCIVAKKIVLR